MTDIEWLKDSLSNASIALMNLNQETELDAVRRTAIQIAASILDDARRPSSTAQVRYCVNPSCKRRILDHDPILAGYCSTMCRESFITRTIRVVHAKYERAVRP
jgi:hypothetical protein